jgi:hypothetical protein
MNTALEKLVEKFAGAKLPITYIEFLRTNAGTQLTEHSFMVPHASGDWEDEIEAFYSEEEIIDAIEREQMLRDGGAKDIPDAMIPIASNGMGDVLYLSLRDSESGAVYFGFHEELDLDSGSEVGLIKLSSSFSDWIASLSNENH